MSGTEQLAPTEERCQHDRIRRIRLSDDATGLPCSPYKAEDLLARMERNGTISPTMQQAGETFQDAFARAHFDPLKASPLLRLPMSAKTASSIMPGTIAAQRAVWNALDAVGPAHLSAVSCCWNVLGWGLSLEQWALKGGWNRNRIHKLQAGGILIDVLEKLEHHYGLDQRARRRERA